MYRPSQGCIPVRTLDAAMNNETDMRSSGQQRAAGYHHRWALWCPPGRQTVCKSPVFRAAGQCCTSRYLRAFRHCATCRELQLADKFEALEKQSYADLKHMITEQKHVPEAVFELFLRKIYKRQK